MKTNFNFALRGIELLRIWVLFLAAVILPYVFLIFRMKNYQEGDPFPYLFIFVFLLMIFGTCLLMFYISRLLIERIEYGGERLEFKGEPGTFFGKLLLGLLLTLVTLGIYAPWFAKKMLQYFSNNTYLSGKAFDFRGNPGTMLLIVIFSFLIPYLLLDLIIVSLGGPWVTFQNATQTIAFQLISLFLFIPYYYLSYKWYIDLDYNGLSIKWHTEFWDAIGQIAMQLLFTILTFGIYGPMAFVRLYKYFIDRSRADAEGRQLRFGYDIEPTRDFLLLWGELLLTIITAGIYYPWALAKVGRHLATKTYTLEDAVAEPISTIESTYEH